ncbi:MAG: bifunctional aspartate kinase/homoserine dehydrogenase I, partial [Niabella sp.]
MQILKFGGSSVANAENINKVINIITNALQNDTTIIVVSALGGVTDLLLQAATLASDGDEDGYKNTIIAIEKKHFEVVKQLIPVASQSQLLSLVKKSVNEIEDICNGIFLRRETTARTKDRLASYGEWLSSRIIAAKMQQDGIDITWKDSRELIITNSHFTQAAVDFSATNKNIQPYFKGNL